MQVLTQDSAGRLQEEEGLSGWNDQGKVQEIGRQISKQQH